MAKAKTPSAKSHGNAKVTLVKTVQQSAKNKGEFKLFSRADTDLFVSSPAIRPEDMAKLNLRRR